MENRFEEVEQRAQTYEAAHDIVTKLSEKGEVNVLENGEVEYVPMQGMGGI